MVLGGFELHFILVNECRALLALSMVAHFGPLTWPLWSGDLPSGKRHESNAAREYMWRPEADNAPEMQGTVYAIYLPSSVVGCQPHIHRRVMALSMQFISLSLDALQGVLYQSGRDLPEGKENQDPAPKPSIPALPLARKVSAARCVCSECYVMTA